MINVMPYGNLGHKSWPPGCGRSELYISLSELNVCLLRRVSCASKCWDRLLQPSQSVGEPTDQMLNTRSTVNFFSAKEGLSEALSS